MRIEAQGFHVPKHGHAEREYEDAYFPSQASHRNLKAFRCAVADGATESVFAREWARILVRGFGKGKLRVGWMRRLWMRTIQGRATGPSVPWYVGAKLKDGAFAAFVGLTLHDGSRNGTGGTWRALAVGDSCLFHVRGSKLLAHGPMARSEDFGSNPLLLSTSGTRKLSRGETHVTVLTGDWKPRDVFFLATDALSQWLLAEQERGRSPWGMLRELGDDSDGGAPFEPIVARLRAGECMKNDDTTLLRVEVG